MTRQQAEVSIGKVVTKYHTNGQTSKMIIDEVYDAHVIGHPINGSSHETRAAWIEDIELEVTR